MPTQLLFNFIELLYPLITHIINSTITTSNFPSNLKPTIIKPIVKDKSQNSNDLNNLRPLNNIPFISKVVEKVLHIQLDNYFHTNRLHATYQSGYKKYNSCETAMVHVIDDMQKHLIEGNYVAILLLDMSAAFDTVDHEILINRLKHNYYLQGCHSFFDFGFHDFP